MASGKFTEGTWWYNQGRSSYQTAYHEGKMLFKQVLREPKEINGQPTHDIYGELHETYTREFRASGWHYEAGLTDGARMLFRMEGERMVSSILRPGTSDWRPAVTAKLGPPDESAVAEPAPEPAASVGPPAASQEELDAQARQKEWERLTGSVNFESLGSRIRRLALGIFVETDISSNVFMSGGTTALRSGLSKALKGVNSLPSKVFDRLTRMPLAQTFEETALDSCADRRAEARKNDPKKTIVPVPAVRLCPGMLHPLSFNEEQMLRLFINDPLSMAYNLSSGLRNQVPLDPKSFHRSQLMVSERHDVLRSAYRMDDYGNPARKVERQHEGGQFMLCVKDAADCQAIQGAEFAVSNRLGICSVRYNLEVAQNGWGFSGFNIDHIMGDADAMATFWAEYFQVQFWLAQGYSEEAVNERLPPLPVQMVDYAYWQRSLVCQGLLESDIALWYHDIASVHPPAALDVPIDIPRRRAWTAVGENYFCHLSGELVTILQEANHLATPFAVVISAFSIILSRLSGTPTIYMGTPFALRMLASLQNLIGDFVNMVIFKVRHDPKETFTSILDRAAASAVDVQRHALAPFLLFVNSVNRFYVTNDPSRNAIYQTMIDVVPKDNEDPNPSMSGILDLFLFANTNKGQLWSIECTSNSTVLQMQTVRSILVQMPILVRHAAHDVTAELPRSMPYPEEALLEEEGMPLVLTHMRLKVGPLPHIVGVASGWEFEGEPEECRAIRIARRLKAQSCLQLGADLPLSGARAQKPPMFVIRMEMKVQEQMAKQQEEREKKKAKPAKAVEGGAAALPAAAPAGELVAAPAAEAASAAAPKLALPAPALAEKEAEDPEAEILAEIEARRAQVRRKLAARSIAKGRVAESKMASELIGLDLDMPYQEAQRPRPRAKAGGRR